MEPLNAQDLDYVPEESVESAISDSPLNMILKSIWEISVFARDLVICSASPLKQNIVRLAFNNNLSLSQPPEASNVFDLFVYILERMPTWKPYFEVYEVSKKNCSRCKIDTEYPVQRCYGLIINANSLREVKALFEHFTFEKILKVIRIDLKMPCDKEGCGKRSYVQRMIINKLPSVFTIALEWEHNETEEEILDTTSVLTAEIDISAIYQYQGDHSIKYCLVSMVCSHGDQYNCVAYEKNRWVRHFQSKKEVIGDGDGVLSIFRKLHIRPEILFFENVMQRDEVVSGQRSENQLIQACSMV